ncbi:TRAP transporter large permease [Aeromicrobium ponti]|uniref:C4-dicarboxylate transporter DctM subunit n=1 Tax=Cytobacillus oceanisediminis TaxID=665099 RepID=A0A562JRM0_9BACI|nr:TRAP transporter large permease [Cytobacillus oceanisediminis]TWH85778.1 C4-dicarboxylate transporter DctM subunit [Cytobacillus oceanisediminis]
MLLILGLTVLLTMVIGVPIAFSLGLGGSLALFIGSEVPPLLVIGQKVFRGMESFPLMAIPFFVLAGELMGKSITTKLINFASSLVGHIRGGLSQVTTLSSMFFGGVTGVGVAETAAIGSIIIPAMDKKGYKKSFAAAVVAASSTLGPIVPPSVPMVIYALSVGGSVSIAGLFLAGVIPAILITVFFMIVSYIIAIKEKHPVEGKFSFANVLRSLKEAIWALFMPLIIVGGMISGIFTATEAAVVAVVYALFIGFVVNKDLKLKDLPEYFVNTSVVTAIVLMLLGVSKIASWVLTVQQVPSMLSEILLSVTESPMIFLIIISILLFIVGCFIESSAAIIMLAPILAPVAMSFGVDPIHFGFMLVMNLMIGMITPPVGVILFVATGIADIKFEALIKAIVPYIVVAYFVLLLVIFFPALTTWIPSLLGY